jgi:hypothetical protein
MVIAIRVSTFLVSPRVHDRLRRSNRSREWLQTGHKENDMTNTTKLIAKLALALGLIASVAFSAVTPSLAQPGSAYQTHGNNDSMGCPC